MRRRATRKNSGPVGARHGGQSSFARLWLPTPLAEAPAPVAIADVAPQPRSQELPVPERVEPPPVVIAPPVGPIGPLGEPLPNPADFAAARKELQQKIARSRAWSSASSSSRR